MDQAAVEPSSFEQQQETPQQRARRELMARILAENAATELDPTAQWHPDVNLAAVDALDRLTGEIAEQAGVLLRRKADGHYAYSVPVQGKNDNFSLRARFGPDLELAGIYHTHPDGPRSRMFSPDDIEAARQLKVLSYIKHLSDGEIRRFDPATTSTTSKRFAGQNMPLRVSNGEVVQRPVVIAKGTP